MSYGQNEVGIEFIQVDDHFVFGKSSSPTPPVHWPRHFAAEQQTRIRERATTTTLLVLLSECLPCRPRGSLVDVRISISNGLQK
jgi:hypothetical protein